MKKVIKIKNIAIFSRAVFLIFSALVFTATCIATNYKYAYDERLKENEYYVQLLAEHEAELKAWHDAVDYPQVVVKIPDENAIKSYNLVAAIGTNKEQEVFGYNVSYVLRVITAEAGAHENEEDINGVTQSIYNAIQRYKRIEGITYTPEQIIYKDQYCGPKNYISYAAKKAFIFVFIEGGTYEKYGDSVIFYNPKVLGHSNVSHERYTLEYETATGVRFFSK